MRSADNVSMPMHRLFAVAIVFGVAFCDATADEDAAANRTEVSDLADAKAELSEVRWQSLARQLSDADYAIREQADQQLRDAGNVAFEAVSVVATSGGEAGSRAIQILEHWAFAGSGDFAVRCEKRLMELSEMAASGQSSLAHSALSTARDIRQRDAYDALIANKARVRFFGDLDEDYEAVDKTNRDVLSDKLRPISLISIYANWAGGEEDLWQLQRLHHQAGLQIRIATKAVPELAVTKATATLESSNVEFRGGSLGLQAETGSPLMVKEAFPGTAAAQAGLQYGDIIISFDDKPVNNIADLITLLRDYPPGTTKVLKFRRQFPAQRFFGRGIDPDDPPEQEPVEGEPGVYQASVTLQGWDNMPTPESPFRMMQQQRQFQPRNLQQPINGPIPKTPLPGKSQYNYGNRTPGR